MLVENLGKGGGMSRQEQIGKVMDLLADKNLKWAGNLDIATHLVDNGVRTADGFEVLYMGHFKDEIVPIKYKETPQCQCEGEFKNGVCLDCGGD